MELSINNDSIGIPSDANLASFRNIDEIDAGSESRMSKLMSVLSCLGVGVVCAQS